MNPLLGQPDNGAIMLNILIPLEKLIKTGKEKIAQLYPQLTESAVNYLVSDILVGLIIAKPFWSLDESGKYDNLYMKQQVMDYINDQFSSKIPNALVNKLLYQFNDEIHDALDGQLKMTDSNSNNWFIISEILGANKVIGNVVCIGDNEFPSYTSGYFLMSDALALRQLGSNDLSDIEQTIFAN